MRRDGEELFSHTQRFFGSLTRSEFCGQRCFERLSPLLPLDNGTGAFVFCGKRGVTFGRDDMRVLRAHVGKYFCECCVAEGVDRVGAQEREGVAQLKRVPELFDTQSGAVIAFECQEGDPFPEDSYMALASGNTGDEGFDLGLEATGMGLAIDQISRS